MKDHLMKWWKTVRSHFSGVAVITAVLVAFVLGFSLRGTETNEANAQAETTCNTEPEQWYTCSMHPEVRMPDPDDKCPICFMELIPVSSSSGGGGLPDGAIELSPEAAALISVETVPVTRRSLTHRVRMVGQIAYDETRLSYLTAYAGGRLDRMFVDYTGVVVREGDHLAEIYSPDLLVARRELVEARRAVDRLEPQRDGLATQMTEAVLSAARERLRLLGLTAEQIETAEAGKTPDGENADHVTLFAPVGGVVIEKHAKPGSYVQEGDPLYTIADLSRVWVMLEAYESDLPWLRYGQAVEFTVAGQGDETFRGQVAFLDPTLDPQTRTLSVRVNVDNADGRLRPGVFVRGGVLSEVAEAGRVMPPELAGKWISPMHPEVIRDEPGDCPVCGMALVPAESMGYTGGNHEDLPLIVPNSSVLRTGTRGVVYVQTQTDPAPRFEGRVVELGPSGDGFVIVRSGLTEGDRVVTRGNFQIDSALQIQAKPSMMNPAADTGQAEEQLANRIHLGGDAASAVRDLMIAYFAFAESLARGNVATAGGTTANLDTAVQALNQSQVPAELNDPIKRLIDTAADLNPQTDLEEHRNSLGAVSDSLIALLQGAHVEGLGTVYRAYCPMALDNPGASWLTPVSEVFNPYFGDRMLRCGSIEETMVALMSRPTPGGQDPHEGH